MRLTEKIFVNNKFSHYGTKALEQPENYDRNSLIKLDNTAEIVDKLGQLEDIEEELGIDLITLFKALKNGVWFKDKNSEVRYSFNITNYVGEKRIQIGDETFRRFQDYGKTWALTKEELSND